MGAFFLQCALALGDSARGGHGRVSSIIRPPNHLAQVANESTEKIDSDGQGNNAHQENIKRENSDLAKGFHFTPRSLHH